LHLGSTVKVDGMTDADTLVPNHHAHHPGFSGVSGLLAALSMVRGREEEADLAIEATGLTGADRLIDLGCGPGSAARRAARRGASVTGVDPARVMLQVARALDPTHRVAWTRGGAEALPLPDRSATVVWSIASVHHWPDLEGGLAECRRVLEPGGRLFVAERHTRPGASGLAGHGWTEAQAELFAAACRTAGFDDVRTASHSLRHRPLITAVGRRA
jgi:ubiquinone/menaquinone biosynthesis C-methylase UbiE